jgi:hypothetical protein
VAKRDILKQGLEGVVGRGTFEGFKNLPLLSVFSINFITLCSFEKMVQKPGVGRDKTGKRLQCPYFPFSTTL